PLRRPHLAVHWLRRDRDQRDRRPAARCGGRLPRRASGRRAHALHGHGARVPAADPADSRGRVVRALALRHHHRAGTDAVAGHHAHRARRRAEPARARVHRRGTRAGHERPAHHPAPPGPQRAGAGHRRGDARHRQHDRAGGRALVPWPGRAGARALVGQDGGGGERGAVRRVVARRVPGPRSRRDRARLQPGGGRAACRARPAAEELMALLEVENLRTYFYTDEGVARAVDGVSFSLEAGEALGIVGESGSGKSVTSLSILRLVPDPPGRIEPGSSIRLRGEELLALPERRMRHVRGNDIAMIFQEPMTSLNPVHTVGAQIVESLRVHRRTGKREAWRRAVELLGLVGIANPEERVHAYPHQLSGGMRQRVMIAMALACEPDVLIAGEPTAALDVTIQAQILELIDELRQRLGTAVLLITHDLGVVAEVCDRVVVMYGGQVMEQGTVEQIFRDPRHPYTEGLLAAIPRLGEPVERLRVIPGNVPGPTAWPQACRFHPRCPYGWDL